MNSRGVFVIVWTGYTQNESDTNVYARLYDSAAQPASGELLLNEDAADAHAWSRTWPGVGMDASGQFLAAWHGAAGYVWTRRFDAMGAPLTGRTRLDPSVSAGAGMTPTSLAMTPDGRSVVVWGTGWSHSYAWAQPLSPEGLPQGSPFVIAEGSGEIGVSIAVDSAGRLGVTSGLYYAATGLDIGARFFSLDGTALTDWVKVNSYESTHQLNPAIAFNEKGRGIVVWISDLQGGKSRLMGRLYNSSGEPAGGEFYIASGGTYGTPSVAMSGDGYFAVVWPCVGTGWDIASRSFALFDDVQYSSHIFMGH
jgi:hypothetical protein